MASDDVADLVLEIQQDRRLPILNLLPAAKQRKVMGLLGYNPTTAGGLMDPDFVAAPVTDTAAETLARVRAADLAPQQIETVCIVDAQGALVAGISLAELVRAEPHAPLSELADTQLPSVQAEADLPEVARLMADYNLLALPVLDRSGAPAGIVGVDDVLELLVPEEWRRRAGAARD
jgi:Mg/Co/Ni transporter MgtE